MDPNEPAELVRIHGSRAAQIVIDRLIEAVREGDESRIATLDRVMREVDRLLAERHRHRFG